MNILYSAASLGDSTTHRKKYIIISFVIANKSFKKLRNNTQKYIMEIFIFSFINIHLKMSHASHKRNLNLHSKPEQVD